MNVSIGRASDFCIGVHHHSEFNGYRPYVSHELQINLLLIGIRLTWETELPSFTAYKETQK